jgi:hypothetical protein
MEIDSGRAPPAERATRTPADDHEAVTTAPERGISSRLDKPLPSDREDPSRRDLEGENQRIDIRRQRR